MSQEFIEPPMKSGPRGPEDQLLIQVGIHEGIPYVGKPLNLKKDDPPQKRPRLDFTAHADTFCLWDTAEKEKYERVCTKISMGLAKLSDEDKQFVPEHKNWVVYIRYLDVIYTTPEAYEDIRT
jgi:hypothetical protein